MDNVARGEKARRLAHSYVGWAVGAGLIPFPLVDVGSLVVLQVKMLTEIAEIYAMPLGRERARTLVMSTLGSLAPQGVALTGIPALLKFIPVVGTLLGVAAMPAAAAASTLALAEVFIRHIETHGRVPDRAWPQLTDSQAASPNPPPPSSPGATVTSPGATATAPGAPPSSPGATATSPAAAFAVDQPAQPHPPTTVPPATTEPPATDGPTATKQPPATGQPDATAPTADGGVAADTPSDQPTAPVIPEAPHHDAGPPDPASGTNTEPPVRRDRSAARTRRRSSPAEKS